MHYEGLGTYNVRGEILKQNYLIFFQKLRVAFLIILNNVYHLFISRLFGLKHIPIVSIITLLMNLLEMQFYVVLKLILNVKLINSGNRV